MNNPSQNPMQQPHDPLQQPFDPPHVENNEPTFRVGTLIGALILLAVGAICISMAFGASINLMTVLIATLVAGAVALLISAFRP